MARRKEHVRAYEQPERALREGQERDEKCR